MHDDYWIQRDLTFIYPPFLNSSIISPVNRLSCVTPWEESSRGVHVDVHVGMWHDFPMYSEGCGSKAPLWQATLALNRCSAGGPPGCSSQLQQPPRLLYKSRLAGLPSNSPGRCSPAGIQGVWLVCQVHHIGPYYRAKCLINHIYLLAVQ